MCPRHRTESPERPQPGGQPVDLLVPFHRLLTRPAARPALGTEPVGQFRDRALEAFENRGEMGLVSGDENRVGLAAEVVGEVEHTGGQWVHVISSGLEIARSLHRVRTGIRGLTARSAILRHHRGLAASPGVRYMLKWEEVLLR
jgi:hypothetical protein